MGRSSNDFIPRPAMSGSFLDLLIQALSSSLVLEGGPVRSCREARSETDSGGAKTLARDQVRFSTAQPLAGHDLIDGFVGRTNGRV